MQTNEVKKLLSGIISETVGNGRDGQLVLGAPGYTRVTHQFEVLQCMYESDPS